MPIYTRHRLSHKQVESLVRKAEPIAISDGAGLTLTISKTGYVSWVLRYRINRRRKEYLSDIGTFA